MYDVGHRINTLVADDTDAIILNMTTTHLYRGIAWIDLLSPDENEISDIVKRYGLHPLVGEELKDSSSLAKIDIYPDYILVVLTLPVRSRKSGAYVVDDREIDFVIGKNFLITSRSEAVEQLEYFTKAFEANSILGKNDKIEHAGHIFYYMVRRIYAGMSQDIENIRDTLVSAETKIYNGDEREMVEALSNISRELIDFKQTARVHHDIWEGLIGYAGKDALFGPDWNAYMRDIRDEFNRIHELLANARELLTDLRETNNSLLNTKQNEIIKKLTLVAFIFYPLTFIASIFTIPAAGVPIVNNPQGWNVLFLFMVALTIVMWWWFKKKRWM